MNVAGVWQRISPSALMGMGRRVWTSNCSPTALCTWRLLASCPELIDAVLSDTPGDVVAGIDRHRLPGSADKVTHMHVKDQIGGVGVWNFPQVGTGEVDFAALFKTLDEAGFNGPCSVEIEFTGEPWPPLDEVNRQMAASYRFVRQFVPGES